MLGIVLLAVGLFRGRVGPRWASIALGLGPVLDAVLGGAAGLAWWQLTVSGAVLLGVLAPAAAGDPTGRHEDHASLVRVTGDGTERIAPQGR